MSNELSKNELLELQQSYRQYIDNLNLIGLTYHETWFHGLKYVDSVRLMSRLHFNHKKYHSNTEDIENTPFDVLLVNAKTIHRMRVLDYRFSLVIIHQIPSNFYSFSTGSCIMSEFKKSKPWYWVNLNKERCGENFDWKDDMVFNLWNNPYNIRAITNYDTDYRKEYRFGELVYEGNNFGDTSDFYIIGSVSKKSVNVNT